MKRIVVGVDGSAPSVTALRWAVAEAAHHGAEVIAVSGWELPVVGASEGMGFSLGTLADGLQAEAQRRLDEVVGSLDAGTVTIGKAVEYGSPARLLLEKAADADLLVVGARGLGGFRGLLLGSVSQHCITHAVCPTVVVPTARGAAPEPDGRSESAPG
jgi:nucleotide-binding universal stress UspA family protein